MADIPSQLSFEHMLAHMFPGFFSALTVFMILDILSPSDITNLIFRDSNAMIGFFGFIFLVGTILGVIIDGVHHKFIELRYFTELDRDVDEEHISAHKLICHILKQMKCNDAQCYENNKSNEAGTCKNWKDCIIINRHSYELLKIYYAFDIDDMDKCIALHDYLRRSVYHYYEFYANTFIAMIPFTFVAPIYIVKQFNIDSSYAFLIGLALVILTIACLDFAWMAYKRWISVLCFAFCRCLEGKTLYKKEDVYSLEIIR